MDGRAAVVDYGMGNLGSVVNMARHIGWQADLVDSPEGLAERSHVILPGVGHFAEAMSRLHDGGWVDVLHEVRERGAWVLGICLGMQLLAKSSEEGGKEGLGWFDFQVCRMTEETADGKLRRVPHMGWNRVDFNADENPTLAEANRFYFVHSYYVPDSGDDKCWATTEYNGLKFASAIRNERVMGVQFHPEKSHRPGMALMRYFAGLR